MKISTKTIAAITLSFALFTQYVGGVAVFAANDPTNVQVEDPEGALNAYIGTGNYNNGDKANLQQSSDSSRGFSGWLKKAGSTISKITSSSTFSIEHAGETDPKYYPDIKYNISIDLDGGTGGTPDNSTYRTTEAYTLANPTRSGYYFEGWTGSNGNEMQTEVIIPQGSVGDKSYKANWSKIVAFKVLEPSYGDGANVFTHVTSYGRNGEIYASYGRNLDYYGSYYTNWTETEPVFKCLAGGRVKLEHRQHAQECIDVANGVPNKNSVNFWGLGDIDGSDSYHRAYCMDKPMYIHVPENASGTTSFYAGSRSWSTTTIYGRSEVYYDQYSIFPKGKNTYVSTGWIKDSVFGLGDGREVQLELKGIDLSKVEYITSESADGTKSVKYTKHPTSSEIERGYKSFSALTNNTISCFRGGNIKISLPYSGLDHYYYWRYRDNNGTYKYKYSDRQDGDIRYYLQISVPIFASDSGKLKLDMTNPVTVNGNDYCTADFYSPETTGWIKNEEPRYAVSIASIDTMYPVGYDPYAE